MGNHNLQANVRYDHVDDAGADTTGYLGYGYDLTSNWKLLASASTVKPPTPPTPKTATLEFFNFSNPSEPIKSSVREY